MESTDTEGDWSDAAGHTGKKQKLGKNLGGRRRKAMAAEDNVAKQTVSLRPRASAPSAPVSSGSSDLSQSCLAPFPGFASIAPTITLTKAIPPLTPFIVPASTPEQMTSDADSLISLFELGPLGVAPEALDMPQPGADTEALLRDTSTMEVSLMVPEGDLDLEAIFDD